MNPDDFMSFDPEDMLAQIRETMEGGEENVMDVLALAIGHYGALTDNHDVTAEFRTAMFVLGQDEFARALGKVTMRIGQRHIMVALAVRAEYRAEHDNDALRGEVKPHLDRGVIAVLNAHGARVELQPDGTFKISSWEDDRPAGQVVDGVSIDDAVTKFREEIDKTLDDPMSRWMPGKEDQ